MTPQIDVVGLGPGGPGLVTVDTLELLRRGPVVILRTGRHPSAEVAPAARTFDHHYEDAETLEGVYASMADDLVAEAKRSGPVVYAVPGSPMVAESSVAELTRHAAVLAGEVPVHIHPAVSFLDVACARLGIDPVEAGVRLVDGESFAIEAAGERGPLLVAQCWSQGVLSGIKLAADQADRPRLTVLWHLGLDDERLWELDWDELDRSFVPDHLTSLWVPRFAAPLAAELVRLDELVHTLRERCPWDREQTHGSLARHLLEEAYEVLEAIDAVTAMDAAGSGPGSAAIRGGEPDADGHRPTEAGEPAVAHLEEELGDLLFQVYFHARLAAEAGRFTLADVARGVHDKLVSRHPHVFGDAEAQTAGEVMANWEVRKLSEKSRTSVTEGIPEALPALALAAKLQRKALAVGMVLPSVADEAVKMADTVARLEKAVRGPVGHDGADGADGRADKAGELGSLLFSVVNVARSLGVDAETALRARDAAFRKSVEAHG
ncbi:MAG TPA: MazG nucleotide pyrophosphohydrolase domain-containing protein [Acidimicrobiales bacterium]|nr:MazG nucleotide pyrophosphohydrolase domain-containing protein [Acidimicrobiales bacterium]